MLSDELKKFAKENTVGLNDQYGTCRFCGQEKLLQTVNVWRQDALDEAAAESCGCFESQEYARIKRMKEKADDALEKKFGEIAEAEAVVSEEQRTLLKKIAHEIADNRIDKASVTISAYKCQLKVGFSVSAKGGIKIERTITKKAVEEV